MGHSSRMGGSRPDRQEMEVHYSSKTCEWETPDAFWDDIVAEFNPTLDVCAMPHNAKCSAYYSPRNDGLSKEWKGVCWMNPPYGREIGKWMRKAYEESLKPGTRVIALVPSRTDTKWWHEYAMRGEIRFIKGRLYFKRRDGHEGRAPFPCALIIFK